MTIGILAKYECISCGNIINHQTILIKTGGSYKFSSPVRCMCGGKNLELMEFNQMSVCMFDENKEKVEIKDLEDTENENKNSSVE
jgi:hypothetical protein